MKKLFNKEVLKMILQILIAFLTALGVASCTKNLVYGREIGTKVLNDSNDSNALKVLNYLNDFANPKPLPLCA